MYIQKPASTKWRVFLPNTSTSKEELESLVCGDSRHGILSSNCSEGFTLRYHSPNYECRNESPVNCSYGIPLYIVSELLPVTLLFLVILIFNINFTSGALSSFVFYAQVIDLQVQTWSIADICILSRPLRPFTIRSIKTLISIPTVSLAMLIRCNYSASLVIRTLIIQTHKGL